MKLSNLSRKELAGLMIACGAVFLALIADIVIRHHRAQSALQKCMDASVSSAYSMVNGEGSPLRPGDLMTNKEALFCYDGESWRLIGVSR